MTLLWIDGFEGYGTGNGNPVSPANVFTRRYAYAVYGTWYCTLAPAASAVGLSNRGVPPGRFRPPT